MREPKGSTKAYQRCLASDPLQLMRYEMAREAYCAYAFIATTTYTYAKKRDSVAQTLLAATRTDNTANPGKTTLAYDLNGYLCLMWRIPFPFVLSRLRSRRIEGWEQRLIAVVHGFQTIVDAIPLPFDMSAGSVYSGQASIRPCAATQDERLCVCSGKPESPLPHSRFLLAC
jgi:hypothetical protein